MQYVTIPSFTCIIQNKSNFIFQLAFTNQCQERISTSPLQRYLHREQNTILKENSLLHFLLESENKYTHDPLSGLILSISLQRCTPATNILPQAYILKTSKGAYIRHQFTYQTKDHTKYNRHQFK